MAWKTSAFDAAAARGWSLKELADRSGLNWRTVYAVKARERGCGPKVIAGFMRAFPDLPFERLFTPTDSTITERTETVVQDEAAA